MSKKILYTDLETLKSVSAQLYKGNLVERDISQGEESGERVMDNFGSEASESSTFRAEVNAIVGGVNFQGGKEAVTHESKEIEENSIESFQETKKIAYDEYLINLVESSLEKMNDLKSENEAKEFDYVSLNKNFEFYDFYNIDKSLKYEMLIPFIFQENMNIKDYSELEAEMNKVKNNKNREKREKYEEFMSMQSIKTVNKISRHLSEILGDYFLMIDEDRKLLIFGQKAYFKIPTLTMSLNKIMTLKVFGLVVSRNNLTISSDVDMSDPTKILRNTGSFSLENYLVNFFGFEEYSEYKIIHPISIEYSVG